MTGVSPCVHRWRISEPDGGARLRAECQICGDEGYYSASFDALVDARYGAANAAYAKKRQRKLNL